MSDNITKRIGILYFSPTNTTKKICKAIALGMGAEVPVDLNITNLDFRTKLSSNPNALLDNIDHIIIGAPVYTGKLPIPVIECLKALNGNGKECTTVVVYGNRDYGIALYHMVEILTNNGFSIKAAGAFIGQHSYSDIVPVAIGRPDNTDLEKACNFGIDSLNTSNYLSLKDILVQRDMFSKSKNYTPIIPAFKSEKCSFCGACSKRCPINIISPETGNFMNQEAKKKCLGCMACVSICKNKARFVKPNIIMKLVLKILLKKPSVYRQEPLTIFSSKS
ncbi:MAG TPA: 4Fe-4S binding protein [Williamwhitmania sp.]|nr:4Fe-4S binding protein [Williamwhitmania sp.]